MSQTPILIIMAAGIGSRFGGLKQLAPIGPNGEGLIDYSLYDALQAGFKRVIFIVNKQIWEDFRNLIGRHAEKRMDTEYIFQELDSLPDEFRVPAGRVKPWGTAHAVMCCAKKIDAAFCAVNGDDLYGRGAMKSIFGFLSDMPAPYNYAMVGYTLDNTLSEGGSVSRGVCQAADGLLKSITERTHIISTCDGPLFTEDNAIYRKLPADTVVSMNLWGFTPEFSDELSARFKVFYKNAIGDRELTAEYYLPSVVGSLLEEGKARVSVLPCNDKWHGITHPADRSRVEKAVASMIATGVYPARLWV